MKFSKFPELVKLIDERSSASEGARRPKSTHYAADTQKCLREQWYGWLGYPITNPPTELVLQQQDAGKMYEMWFKDLVKRAGLWRADEYYIVMDDPPSSMRVDMLFDVDALYYFYKLHRMELALVRELPPLKEGVVSIPLEIKSTSPNAYEGWKDHPGYKDIPMWGHYCQVQLYLNGMDAPFGFLVYINRSTTERSSHLIGRDDSLIKLLIDRQRALGWFVKNNICPEREGGVCFGPKGGYQPDDRCGICNYQYYDFFDEIIANGTRAEKSKMMDAIRPIPEKFQTPSMKEYLGRGTENGDK